jgi:hypothetical protein
MTLIQSTVPLRHANKKTCVFSLAKGIEFTTNRHLFGYIHKESGGFVIKMINMFFVKIMAYVAKGLPMLFLNF